MTEAEALTRKIVEIFDIDAFDLIPSLIAPEYVDHLVFPRFSGVALLDSVLPNR